MILTNIQCDQCNNTATVVNDRSRVEDGLTILEVYAVTPYSRGKDRDLCPSCAARAKAAELREQQQAKQAADEQEAQQPPETKSN